MMTTMLSNLHRTCLVSRARGPILYQRQTQRLRQTRTQRMKATITTTRRCLHIAGSTRGTSRN